MDRFCDKHIGPINGLGKRDVGIRCNGPSLESSRFPRNPIQIQLSFEYLTRLKCSNAGVEGLGRRDIEEGCKIINSLSVWLTIDAWEIEKSPDLTGEYEAVSPWRIKQRLDSETISG